MPRVGKEVETRMRWPEVVEVERRPALVQLIRPGVAEQFAVERHDGLHELRVGEDVEDAYAGVAEIWFARFKVLEKRVVLENVVFVVFAPLVGSQGFGVAVGFDKGNSLDAVRVLKREEAIRPPMWRRSWCRAFLSLSRR